MSSFFHFIAEFGIARPMSLSENTCWEFRLQAVPAPHRLKAELQTRAACSKDFFQTSTRASWFARTPLLLVGIGGMMLSGCATQLSSAADRASTTPPAPQTRPMEPNAVLPTQSAETLFPVNEWKPFFDGKTMHGWRVTAFAGHGEIAVEKYKDVPAIVIEQGGALSGVNWTNAVLKTNYEISLEAAKVAGSDFFCGLTFPFGESHCTLVVGGWGGAVVGISSVDGNDASQNETTKFIRFEENRWYRIRVRVTSNRIETWIDDDQVVNLDTTEKKIAMRSGEIEDSIPLGLATWQTTAAIRKFDLRRIPAAPPK